MLYLDSALSLEGLTLYRDYSVPSRFFYLPGHPRLTREAGDSMFQLLIFRRDITDNPAFREGDALGGGFLTMTVDLSVPESTIRKVRGELERRVGGDVDLVPVPFERGSVRITALGEAAGGAASLDTATGGEEGAVAGPRFVEKILGSAQPSLYGDNRAVFSMRLSHEGAQLMRASLEDDGASQIAVVYNLDYKGLMPAYRAKIKIHFQRSYQYLRNRFSLNTLLFKTDLDSEVEKLLTETSIEIEEVDFSGMTPEAAAQSRDKLNELVKELATQAFFRPALRPGSVLAVDRGELVAADPTAAAQQVTAGFSTPLAAAAEGRGAPGGSEGPRLSGTSGDTRQARAAGRPLPEGESRPESGTAGGGTAAGGERPLTAVERWNQMGRPQAAFLLKSLSQEEQQDLTYDLFQVSAADRSAAPQGQIRLLPGASNMPGRIKEVDLGSPFFERISGTVTTSANLDELGVSSLAVKLRYGVRDDGTAPKDSVEFILRDPGEVHNYSFFLDRRLTMELEYQVVVNYQSGFALGDPATVATSPWKRTTTRNLDIDPAEVAATFPVRLTAAQVDWTAVRAIEATLDYRDEATGRSDSRTVALTQAEPEAQLKVRPWRPEARGYELSARYIFAEGDPATVERTGAGAAAIVLNQPTHRAVPITIAAADPLGRFQKIVVELEHRPGGGRPAQHRVLTFSSNGETQTWTVFRESPGVDPVYRYRTTVFADDGSQAQSEWRTASDRFLVVGEVFEELLSVAVRLLVPDFTAAGLLGVKLRLHYPDAAEHADDDREHFFAAPSLEPFQWTVPKRPGGGDQYEYTVTWINTDGSQRVVGPVRTADEELILHPSLGG